MRVWFHTDRIAARRGERVTLEGFVQNSFAHAVDVSYAMDADRLLNWSVLGPSRVEAQATVPITVEVQVPRDLPVTHASVPVELIVQIAQTDLQARAGTIIDVADEPRGCAAFTAAPTVKLNADGTATLRASIANCGSFDLSVDLRVRHVEGWTFDLDTSEVTLSTGAGPVDVTAVIGRRGKVTIDVGDTLEVEVTADGQVLTSATLPVLAATDGWRQRARRLLSSSVVAIVVVLALALLGPRLLGDQQPTAAETPTSGNAEPEPPPPEPPLPEPPLPEPPLPDPPAPSIVSFAVRFDGEACAVELQWVTTDDRGVRLVRTLLDEQVEISLEPDATATVDRLLDSVREVGVGEGTVRYELFALGAEPSDTTTEIQDVGFSCVLEQPKPDLVISDAPTGSNSSEILVVDVTIANAGTAPSDASVVGLALADESGSFGAARLVDEIPRLDRGQAHTIELSCQLTTMRVTADPNDVVDESREDNNGRDIEPCAVGG